MLPKRGPSERIREPSARRTTSARTASGSVGTAEPDEVESLLEALVERFAAAATCVLGRPVPATTEAIMALDSETLDEIDALMEREFDTYLQFPR